MATLHQEDQPQHQLNMSDPRRHMRFITSQDTRPHSLTTVAADCHVITKSSSLHCEMTDKDEDEIETRL